MFTIKNVSLAGHASQTAHLQFLSVDLAVRPALPLAVVYYAIDNAPQELGLRLDLDKKVFLDQLEDPALQAEAEEAVNELCRFLFSRKARALTSTAKAVSIGGHVRPSLPPRTRAAGKTGERPE